MKDIGNPTIGNKQLNKKQPNVSTYYVSELDVMTDHLYSCLLYTSSSFSIVVDLFVQIIYFKDLLDCVIVRSIRSCPHPPDLPFFLSYISSDGTHFRLKL